jgi:hypothetical protein
VSKPNCCALEFWIAMKFVLKVLVLAFLIIVSKLAKDQTIAMEKPTNATSIDFSKNNRQAVLLPSQRVMETVEMEGKSILHLD